MRNKVQQLARYYLVELWNNADFRADWERVKRGEMPFPDFETRWKLPRAITTAFLNELMSALSELGYGYEAEVELLAQLWHGQPSPRFGNLLATIEEIRRVREREHASCLPKFRFAPNADFELTSLLHRIQPETGGSRSIALQAEDGRLIATLEPQLPEPPLKCLPEPDPATETQSEYIRRICTSIPLTANTSEPETYLQKAIREYRERFNNRRAGAGKVKELARRYYEACFAVIRATRFDKGTEEEYLRRVARQVYLRVIENKSWSEIVDTLIEEGWLQVNWKYGGSLDELSEKERGKVLESWRQGVAFTTRQACELLGIPDTRE